MPLTGFRNPHQAGQSNSNAGHGLSQPAPKVSVDCPAPKTIIDLTADDEQPPQAVEQSKRVRDSEDDSEDDSGDSILYRHPRPRKTVKRVQDRIKDESSEYAEDPNESGSDEYAELEVEADTESDDCRPPRSRRPRKNNGAQNTTKDEDVEPKVEEDSELDVKDDPEASLSQAPSTSNRNIPRRKKRHGDIAATAEEEKTLDELVSKYRKTTGYKNLRCLIRLLLNPLAVEGLRAGAMARLDSYAGGVGQTQRKLEQSLAGTETSIRDGSCLVRAKPRGKRRGERWYRHIYSFTDTCLHCGSHHKWGLQQGFWDAIIMGRFTHVTLLDALLGGYDGSHVCHNAMCSDPFHFVLEHRGPNQRRQSCNEDGKCEHNGPNETRCRLELVWASKHGWEKVKKACDRDLKDIVKPAWRCSAGCLNTRGPNNHVKIDDQENKWYHLKHWKYGCLHKGKPELIQAADPNPRPPSGRGYRSLTSA